MRRLLSRPLLGLGRLLPLLVAAGALFLVEASAESDRPEAVPLAAAPAPTRLVVFWIDSLSTLDLAEPERLTRLKARLPSSLHGPVRSCTDAISVPCFTAMHTGLDRFSLFALARNFGGSDGVPDGSVFHALQKRGHKLGFIGDPQVAPAVKGFDWIETTPHPNDVGHVRRGLEQMEARGLDVVVIHLRDPDEISHKEGPKAPEYAAAMEIIDREIDAAMARLRPTDHVVVMGDHGHTPDGRHFAGLDVPTYAAHFGPAFARPLERPMAMTDYAGLWARVFGLRFGEVPWVDAYFAGETLAPLTELPPVESGDSTLPGWAIAVCLLLAFVVGAPFGVRWVADPAWRRVTFATLAVGMASFALGLGYTAYRPTLYLGSPAFNAALGLGFGLIGLVFALPALRVRFHEGGIARRVPAAMFVAGAVAFALPTVYKFGGLYVALTALLATLVPALVSALRGRRFGQAAAVVGLGALLLTVWDPAVRNFAVRWFPFYTEKLGAALPAATVALAALAVLLPAVLGGRGPAGGGRGAWLAGGAVGLGLALVGPHLPVKAFIAPCLLALPLAIAAHRLPRLAPVALAVALPATAFFFQWEAARIAPVAATLAAWPLWARARRDAPALERGAGALVLLWTVLWTMVGCRIGGIDFNYFFAWLPPGANVEDSWGANALMTLGKYLTLPTVAVLLARRTAPETVESALPVAWHLGRIKLAFVLLFVVGFSARPNGAGPFITADVLQEAGVWVALLLFLLPLPITTARRGRPLQATLPAAAPAPVTAAPEKLAA